MDNPQTPPTIAEAQVVSMEEARTMVALEEQQRIQSCNNMIQQVLQKHNCQLVAFPQITPDGRVVAVVQIQPMR